MKLYVNGDSHSAGAEAVHSAAFAEDDRRYQHLGRRPHPLNLEASYGAKLAKMLDAEFVCDAESASSNDRIIRTTMDYLNNNIANKPDLIVIGWATWEREEWLHNGVRWQVNAGGIGDGWPQEIKDRYKTWVINQMEPEVINQKLVDAHSQVIALHDLLTYLQIPHIFFNTYLDFSHLYAIGYDRYPPANWRNSYIHPYDPEYTYYNWLKAKGFETATKHSYHFKADAHTAWAEWLYSHYVQNLLTK